MRTADLMLPRTPWTCVSETHVKQVKFWNFKITEYKPKPQFRCCAVWALQSAARLTARWMRIAVKPDAQQALPTAPLLTSVITAENVHRLPLLSHKWKLRPQSVRVCTNLRGMLQDIHHIFFFLCFLHSTINVYIVFTIYFTFPQPFHTALLRYSPSNRDYTATITLQKENRYNQNHFHIKRSTTPWSYSYRLLIDSIPYPPFAEKWKQPVTLVACEIFIEIPTSTASISKTLWWLWALYGVNI